MIKSKLYLYDSTKEDFKGTDYSSYILIGDTTKDDLTEVMGTVELTLAGLPSRKNEEIKSEEFDPETLFVYERVDMSENGEIVSNEIWHMCVQQDLVSQPILSDDNYFDHHMTLQEASAIAQKRLVDNIAVTYRLQDVSLNGETVIDKDKKAICGFVGVTAHPTDVNASYNVFEVDAHQRAEITIGKKLQWQFTTGNKTDWTEFPYYVSIPRESTTTPIDLPVPMLEILNCQLDESQLRPFYHMGHCGVRVVVTEKNLITNNSQTIIDRNVQPSTSIDGAWVGNGILGYERNGVIVDEIKLLPPSWSFDFPTSANLVRVADYNTTPVSARRIQFNAKKNCKYSIKIILINNFTYVYNQEGLTWFFNYTIGSQKRMVTNSSNVYANIEFMTYESGDENRIVFKPAPERNAYELFQKAQINTQNVMKQQGVPINETPQTFLLDNQDVLALQNTTVVENFYNQKNWWELLLEIGKYIHSIPKVVFDSDNRFKVTWQKLGETTEYESIATKMSIFNSRSIENYISACSSYIANMVQLGGIIDEWVAPKTSSEDYLVSNDTAEIKVSKPIIEIVDMQVKNINQFTLGNTIIPAGTVGELVNVLGENGYIYEENVYNLFSLDPNEKANKGLAIYYQLGSDTIKGLTYRLPTKSVGDAVGEYAIKRILGTIYAPSEYNHWQDIKVNNFLFHVVYRTKDTARSDQTRPDLRKYLLASKYDRAPQHNQFNNQTDTVVDSTKFGNNIYGKLIRTGNTEYTMTEWVSNLISTRHVGELYSISGQRYYVATVSNTNYGTHIISEVTFSKDYNQLSEIIGIPSEPRFYEISEQSLIEREVPLDDYIVVGTSTQDAEDTVSFVRGKGWTYIDGLLFHNETDFPKYAISVFKNDIDCSHNVTGDDSFYQDVCHPISAYSIQNTLTLEWDMVDNFSAGDRVSSELTTQNLSTDEAYRTLEPVRYVDANGRSDLVDFMIMTNFMLNNQPLTSNQILALPNSPIRTRYPEYQTYIGTLSGLSSFPTNTQLNNYVNSQKGRSPLAGDGIIAAVTVDNKTAYYFYLYLDGTWVGKDNDSGYSASVQQAVENIRSYNREEYTKPHILPYADKYLFGNEEIATMGDNAHGLGLLKDNREAIHFNYNLQMISDSDRFVLSAWLWQPQKGNLKLALLNQEINKISNETVSEDNVMKNLDDTDREYDFTTTVDEANGTITINIADALQGVDLTNVKALAIVSDNIVADNVTSGARYFVMGRNISDLDTADITGELTPKQAKEKAKANWYISNYSKSMFPHQ